MEKEREKGERELVPWAEERKSGRAMRKAPTAAVDLRQSHGTRVMRPADDVTGQESPDQKYFLPLSPSMTENKTRARENAQNIQLEFWSCPELRLL